MFKPIASWPFCLVFVVAPSAWSLDSANARDIPEREVTTKAGDPRGEDVKPFVNVTIDVVRPTCGNVVCGEGGRCPTCTKPEGRR